MQWTLKKSNRQTIRGKVRVFECSSFREIGLKQENKENDVNDHALILKRYIFPNTQLHV